MVRTAVALEHVVAFVAGDGVVVVAATDAVGARRTVVHGLAVDAGSVHAVEWAVPDLAVRHLDQEPVLVALRLWIIVHRADAGDDAS